MKTPSWSPVRSLLVCMLVGSLAGCGALANASPARKIGDTVKDMNDRARWGRVGDAAQYVDPSYRATYLQNHRLWGSKIQLADVEVVQLQISNDTEQATAFVTYSWYGMDNMTLHQSTVRQRWLGTKESYVLMSEAVIQGNTALLGSQGLTGTGEGEVSLLGGP